MIWFLAHPPPPPVSDLVLHPLPSVGGLIGDTQEDYTGGGEGDGRGAESYDRKQTWASINHSILSAATQNSD